MFVLGHLGIGRAMGARFSDPRALRWLLFGCLLPDLIDKPLYYGLSIATGLHGSELGLISGTRTFGHTLFLTLIAWLILRRRPQVALAIGMATHLLLDEGGELLGALLPLRPWMQASAETHSPPTIAAILWPLLGGFPVAPFRGALEHVMTLTSLYTLAGELIGAVLLFRWWRSSRRSDA